MSNYEERETQSGKAEALLEILRETPGKPVGNYTLMRQLGLEKSEFYELRDSLMDEGIVTKARGKGGATKLICSEEESETPVIEAEIVRELDLYTPLKKVLEQDWVKDYRYGDHTIVQIIANQGSRKTGGMWTRPDLVIVTKRSYVFTIGSSIEVTTFEVKPKGYFKVKDKAAVFETASHSTFANKSYLMFYVNPDEVPESDSYSEIEILPLCEEFGIGLVLFTDPSDYSSFVTILDEIGRAHV